jgi:hypothetical protein
MALSRFTLANLLDTGVIMFFSVQLKRQRFMNAVFGFG